MRLIFRLIYIQDVSPAKSDIDPSCVVVHWLIYMPLCCSRNVAPIPPHIGNVVLRNVARMMYKLGWDFQASGQGQKKILHIRPPSDIVRNFELIFSDWPCPVLCSSDN